MLKPLKKKDDARKIPQYIRKHIEAGSDVYTSLKQLIKLDPVPLDTQRIYRQPPEIKITEVWNF